MSRTEAEAGAGSRPPTGDDQAFPGRPEQLPTPCGLDVRERFPSPGTPAPDPTAHALGGTRSAEVTR